MIDATQLARRYRLGDAQIDALRGVDLQADAGEHLAIMGPSGSGKSTLLHLLGLLDRPDGGSYRFQGAETASFSAAERARLRCHEIGVVFQSFHLLADGTAAENVALPLLYAGVPRKQRRTRAAQALERVGLSARAGHRSSQLSGGERQRVAIARAIVREPSLLLADEPTGNLDSATGEVVLDLFAELKHPGLTLIVVTHDGEVAARADRRLHMRDGVLEALP